MKKYKGICFDLYKTILDISTDNFSDVTFQVFTEWVNEDFGSTLDWKLVKDKGIELFKRAEEKIKSDPDLELQAKFVIEELLGSFGIEPDNIDDICYKYRVASRNKISIYKDVKEVLNILKSSYKLILLTNAQKVFTEPELEMFGLRKYFEPVIISSDTGYKKPSEKYYEKAADLIKIDYKNLVMVGNDYNTDISGANKMGMTAVLIDRGNDVVGADNKTGKPDYIINCMSGLLNILEDD